MQILFVINQPDVYKSPSSNTYMYVTFILQQRFSEPNGTRS